MGNNVKIGIIGAGRVGSTLGRRWSGCGHEIVYGVRDLDDSKYADLSDHAQVVSAQQAARDADIVLLSVHWPAARAAVESIKAELEGKILIDCTNPVGADLGPAKSAAELIQGWAPTCTVVKAFNQIGSNIMEDPLLEERKTALFVAGSSAEACTLVEGLATELDFDVIKMPSLSDAHLLEAYAMIWIKMSYQLGYGREFAFSLLKRNSARAT